MIDASRKIYSTRGDVAAIDEIQSGCLQRIADAQERQAVAAEAMAKDREKLVEDRDRYKRLYEHYVATSARLRRSNAALRGHLKRAKRHRDFYCEQSEQLQAKGAK